MQIRAWGPFASHEHGRWFVLFSQSDRQWIRQYRTRHDAQRVVDYAQAKGTIPSVRHARHSRIEITPRENQLLSWVAHGGTPSSWARQVGMSAMNAIRIWKMASRKVAWLAMLAEVPPHHGAA